MPKVVGVIMVGQKTDYVTTLDKTVASYTKTFSRLGKLSFGASTLILEGLTKNYYMNGGTNSSVGIKASLDLIMGGVGFSGSILRTV